MDKQYEKGFRDATEMVEVVTEIAAVQLTSGKVSAKELVQIIDKFISTTYIMKFALDQMDDDTCDGNCEECSDNDMEQLFNKIMKEGF